MALKAPRINLLMTDGAEHSIKLPLKAQLQYGRTARARHWPTAQDAPDQAMAFMAWYALTQIEGIYDFPFEEFEDRCEWLEEQGEEDLTEGDEDFPTK